MYCELWETDRVSKAQREEEQGGNLIERNRECLEVALLLFRTYKSLFEHFLDLRSINKL